MRFPVLYTCQRYSHTVAGNIFSLSGKWPEKYMKAVRQELESHWKQKVKAHDEKVSGEAQHGTNKHYVLSMFPYPSGALHMGHVRVYSISDLMARYFRLRGKSVIHPMGWDAFGLPAENAAIQRGIPADQWTYSNIDTMKKQLLDLCCSFDWHREFATCDPGYYKWTQYIFLKMFEHGLVYQKLAPVHWDPVDQTVLADEQIDEKGRSWRSGAVVEKKMLKQWYIRTSSYAQSLLAGLNRVDPLLWKDVISLQRNWIGNCDGMRLEFPLTETDQKNNNNISLFTTRPEAVCGISHVLISKDHHLTTVPNNYKDKSQSVDSCNDIELNVKVINPLTQQHIPVFVSPSFSFGENADSHCGIPSCSNDDKEFAQKYQLSVINVIDSSTGLIINSAQLSGLNKEEAVSRLPRLLKEHGSYGYLTSSKARDWLISRQRYWGTPIPVVHCPKYGPVPVAYCDLPVTLPKLGQFKGEGMSPLAGAHDWLKTKCSRCDCDGYGMREADTMDTFVDSSWYFLRYLDPDNQQEPVSKTSADRFMPVDLYIGGKEHAIMHLFYARFVSHFLHDIGVVPTREPFVSLLTQGMVMGRSYQTADDGKYLKPDDVDLTDDKMPREKSTGKKLIAQWEKMSKSKFNGVDPQMVLDTHGTDATRLCILSNVAPKSDRLWSDDAFVGVQRWQGRVWSLVTDFIVAMTTEQPCRVDESELNAMDEKIFDARNFCVKETTFHIERSFLINTALSRLMSLTSVLKVPTNFIYNSRQYERALCDLIVMVTPFTPMFASELWTGVSSVVHHSSYDHNKPVLMQKWPTVDSDYRLSMTVKVNGKDAFDVKLPMCIGETNTLTLTEALQLARNHGDFSKTIGEEAQILHPHLHISEHPKVELELEVPQKMKKKKRQ